METELVSEMLFFSSKLMQLIAKAAFCKSVLFRLQMSGEGTVKFS
jgi:hypothetical protein